MEKQVLAVILLLALLAALGIIVAAFRIRVARHRRHRDPLPRSTDATVRADRGETTGAGSEGPRERPGQPPDPERPDAPLRPGADNLTRYR